MKFKKLFIINKISNKIIGLNLIIIIFILNVNSLKNK